MMKMMNHENDDEDDEGIYSFQGIVIRDWSLEYL